MHAERCFFCSAQDGVESRDFRYVADEHRQDSMTLSACSRCWSRISIGAWELIKEGKLIRLRDSITKDTICRRVTGHPSYSGDAYETSLQNLEAGYKYVVQYIEVLPWEELTRVFNLMGQVGEYAWKIRAFCVAEAYDRMVGSPPEKVQQVGSLYGIRRSSVFNHRKIARTFAKERVLASNLPERIFIKATYTSNPGYWITYAEEQRSRNPQFSLSDLTRAIKLEEGEEGLPLSPKSPPIHLDQLEEDHLQVLHAEIYSRLLRKSLIRRLNSMSPDAFQNFVGHELLPALGYDQVSVSGSPGDGGVDVRGTLRVPYADIRAEFQVKRYSSANVASNLIREFRGSLRPEFHIGTLITTSDFTDDAKAEAERPGVKPIQLWSGDKLAEMMIEKGVGVRTENLPLKQIDERFFARFVVAG